MKKKFSLTILFALGLVSLLLLPACEKNVLKKTVYVAKGQAVEEIRNSFSVQPAKTVAIPAGIYASGNYLFLLEQDKGISIIDNSVRESPTALVFINLLSNTHVAVKDDILLADNGVDLISIDISDVSNPVIVHRVENVFKEKWLEEGKTIFVGYEPKQISIFKKSSEKDTLEDVAKTAERKASIAIGKGGSENKFAIEGNYLYILKTAAIKPIDISNPSSPVENEEVGYRESGFETIFPYKGYLYVGSPSGILIVDAKTSPVTPNFVQYVTRTVRGCDPVVVQNDHMFSTVRGGTVCNRTGISSLMMFNIKNKNTPFLKHNENVDPPYGLGIDGTILFVCMGENGLDIYNWNEATETLTFRYRKTEVKAFDVITKNNTLIVAADNGLFQYDYTNPDNIYKLAKISGYDY